MTHYTILTIKQQILILIILQFIHSINGDESKKTKISKKVLLNITMTFRQCDGG